MGYKIKILKQISGKGKAINKIQATVAFAYIYLFAWYFW